MDIITRDLLINFLLILLPLFLVQMFYLLKYAYRFGELKEWMTAVFPSISIVLCMIFPIDLDENFVWDLRGIPFILGALYGGYKLGIPLLALILTIRFIMGGVGFYAVLVAFPLLAALVLLLSKYYLKAPLKQKILISSSLVTVLTLMITFMGECIFFLQIDTKMWIKYIFIHISGIIVATVLWEVIRTNFEVLQKLMKAEKLEMVSHLAASISHEVRNPLTVSRGFMQMLAEDVNMTSQTRKDYAQIAVKELDRASEVINDYLTFAKPSTDNKETLSVFDEIHHTVNVITPLANMNGVYIKLSLLNGDFYVSGERKKFQQCLVNIVKNGIESMPSGGELEIELRKTASAIQIDIRDQGKGMTQEQIHRLGEPYYTTKEKGTGLGMMVSFSIISGMNGKISVTSELEKGTCFSITLPIHT
ncbi:two-component sensor histidine kinase [Priestia megaterium]|nr:two-component sensor histidine kinase [Priestia megaterium]